jgi:RNA polymerase sigma-70 factor (ECF subfamily)
MVEEAELVRRAARGDMDAFEALFHEYKGHAFAVAMSIVGQPAEAAEVVQDAFLTALEALPRLRDFFCFAAWFTTIVRRKAFRHLRSPNASIEDVPLDESATFWERRTPLDAAIAIEAQARLRKALDELPERLSRVLELKYGKRLTYEEIARALEVPLSTIRSRLYDARRLLKERLVGFEGIEDLGGVTMSAETMPFPWPTIRVNEAEPAATAVDFVEDPGLFLRLEPGATAETVTFCYWDWSSWSPPRPQARVTCQVVGPATVEDEPCVELRCVVYKPDGKEVLSEITRFASHADDGFRLYLSLIRSLDPKRTSVNSLVSRAATPDPLWPPRLAVGETYTRYGRSLTATRWVDVVINARPFRCIEVLAELGGAAEGEQRHDRHYISADGSKVLMLRYDTQRTWEHRPDVEPLHFTVEGRECYVERSVVPRRLLRNDGL